MAQVHCVGLLMYEEAIKSLLTSDRQPPLMAMPAPQVAVTVFAPPTDVVEVE
jgi:hypothetical protein